MNIKELENTFHDIIIIGSGPASVSAALAISNRRILNLDIGIKGKENKTLDRNYIELRNQNKDLTQDLMGKELQSLNNVFKNYLNPKLKSPSFNFIIQDSDKHLPREEINFESIVSFSKGGLANAWGAGAYRFTEQEFSQFPFHYQDLLKAYDHISEHMGISGVTDDSLSEYFGDDQYLQPPLNIPDQAQAIANKYHDHYQYFEKNNIFIGRQRHAILSKDKNGRAAYKYNQNDFFKYPITGMYTPNDTLKDLNLRDNYFYQNNIKITSFKSFSNYVEVYGEDLSSGLPVKFKGNKLLLGMGCLNTTACVLRSSKNTKLPLLDNKISYIPFLNPFKLGVLESKRGISSGWLSLMLKDETYKYPLMGSIYGLSGPLRSDVIYNFPLSIPGCLSANKAFLNSMIICQLFYPGQKSLKNTITLNNRQELAISFGQDHYNYDVESKIIKVFRKLNLFSHKSLIQRPPNGNSFHYAATLPMREKPNEFETDKNGKLFKHENIYIIDAANFSDLPSKNFTLTIMANAFRIGQIINKENKST